MPILKNGLTDSIPNVRLVALKVIQKLCNKDMTSLMKKSIAQDVMALTEESEIDVDCNYFANQVWSKLN